MAENNKVLSWNEFKAKAVKIDKLYNRTWLKTEYHHTIANAKATADFLSYQAQSDLYPNLTYNAVADGRTRPQHMAYNGYTATVNDPIWNKLLPPNDWGCRCSVSQTDNPVSTHSPKTNSIKSTFQNNPATSGEIFTKNAGYSKMLSNSTILEADKFARKQIKIQQQNLTKDWAKKNIPEKEGLNLKAPNFQTKQIHLNRRAVKEIMNHTIDPIIKAYPRDMIKDLSSWKYEGWGKLKEGKHLDCFAFTYYSKDIAGIKRYLNVKVHKRYGEYPYAIMDGIDEKDLINGNLPKNIIEQIKK